MEPDFSGYATKAGLKCRDGRTITKQAFQHMDGQQVPLVWQHGHDKPDNVLGHGVLKVVNDGVRVDGYFNDTPSGQRAKLLVQHKDIESLSIYANDLVEKAKSVLHGVIREVSLVLAGANPGAKIDFVRIAHGDGEYETLEDEAVIYSGQELEILHSDEDDELAHAEDSTVREIYDNMSDEQKAVLHYMVGVALENAGGSMKQSDDNPEDNTLEHQEGTGDVANVFEQNKTKSAEDGKHVLTHDGIKEILGYAEQEKSLKKGVEAYALKHGIETIDILFPEARTLNNTPEWNKRRTEWVAGVLNRTRKSPFSRVKSIVADLTQDEARAKGYIKGNYKKEQWFGLTKRVTTPTTVYKKQKLDRDDVVDISDFDVVAWIKGEMRFQLEEEIARSILIGDGRDPGDEDKVKDPGDAAEGAGIRSILNENELYATRVNIQMTVEGEQDYNQIVKDVLRARKHYKGTGTPTLYTTDQVLVEMLLSENAHGDRRWKTKAELAAALMVDDIVTVEVMEDQEPDLLGIIVNLADYNIGADRGGEVNMFDDFDIDYNQLKYLIETRVSGALVKIKSALVLMKTAADSDLIVPQKPAFNQSTGVVTIPTQTGVTYKNAETGDTLSAGVQSALDPGEKLIVEAVAGAGYHFATSVGDEWTFKRPTA